MHKRSEPFHINECNERADNAVKYLTSIAKYDTTVHKLEPENCLLPTSALIQADTEEPRYKTSHAE